MGVDLRLYIAANLGENRWWCDTNIALGRDSALWDAIIQSKCEEPVPSYIEVYTYGADGNTKFVLDECPYGHRITSVPARKLGALLQEHSIYAYNRCVGLLLMCLHESVQIILYWH